MIQHIDVSSVLRDSVRAVYSDLVTRPTGAAVRERIERHLAEAADTLVTVIDFSQVGLLDFSCADEIVAKLLLRFRAEPPGTRYFVFRGMSESHLDAIEAVLERHGLVLLLELDDGAPGLVGPIDEEARRVWRAAAALDRVDAAALARALETEPAAAARHLEWLCQHRLLIPRGDGYVPVKACA